MIHFAFTPDSAKVDDHVFVIVNKPIVNKAGRRTVSKGKKKDDFEVTEAVISEIHYGWNYVSMQNCWSCALATLTNDPDNWRYIDNVSLTDCFMSRKEAEHELLRRFADAEGTADA